MEEKQSIQNQERREPRSRREISEKDKQQMLGKRLVEREGKWYGFNRKGKFACLGKSSSKHEEVRINEKSVRKILSCYWSLMTFDNTAKALIRLKVGDDFQVLNDYITQIKREKKEQYQAAHPLDSLERFIGKIERPKFERATGNTQEGTFDFIRVDVSIITEWHMDRMDYIRKHQKEITKKVVSKIEESKQFQKMGVPINFLRVSEMTLRRDSILEYVFELKAI